MTTTWWPASSSSTGCTPSPSRSAVGGALASVRPFLAHHDGDVELLAVEPDGGAVVVRLLGNCDGCPSSAVTMQRGRRAGDRRGGAGDRRASTSPTSPPSPVPAGVEARWPYPQAGVRRLPVGVGGRAPAVLAVSDALGVLRRIRQPPQPRVDAVCELCGGPLADEHGHLVDLERRGLLCACRSCALLFTADGSGGQRFRAVPDRYRSFPGRPALAGAVGRPPDPGERRLLLRQLDARSRRRVQPRAGGRYESPPPLDAWDDLVDDHPELADMAPDVEAMLVRVDDRAGEAECFVVPIDVCYELVGQLRRLWKGFDGGAEARAALDAFFARVRSRAGDMHQ